MKINKGQWFAQARWLHRFLVLATSLLGLVMLTSGLFLKYPFLVRFFPFFDLSFWRFWHNFLSPFFGVCLFLMALSGLVMYFLTFKK